MKLEVGDRTFGNWKLESPFAWFLILVSVFDPSKLQTGEFFFFSFFFSPWFDMVFVFETFFLTAS